MTRAKDISKILTDADISGNIDVDGVTNLDVVDIDGAVDFASTTAHASNATFADGAKAIFGAGNDLKIYHDGSNSYIEDLGTGDLIVQTNGANFLVENTDGDDMIKAISDGAVEISHNNVKKFETTSTGVTVTGNIANASGDFTLDVGGDIILDADGGDVNIADGGTTIGVIANDGSSNFVVKSSVQDKDIIFKGNDGGSGIEAARFDMSADGAFCIGATSRVGAGVLGVSFNDAAVHGIDIIVEQNASGAGFVVFRTAGGGIIGQIKRNTTADEIQYVTTSDYRLKENVNYEFDATTTLKKLKPCEFNWISDEKNSTITGFLAHEVQEIYPHATSGEKDATEIFKDADDKEQTIIKPQGIDKSDLVPLLTKALQEQQATIEALTARIKALEDA